MDEHVHRWGVIGQSNGQRAILFLQCGVCGIAGARPAEKTTPPAGARSAASGRGIGTVATDSYWVAYHSAAGCKEVLQKC